MNARVLVTDAGRGSAIAVIRSLGRRGVRVVAADSDPRSPGFRSRYAAATVVYPPPWERPGDAVAVVAAAAREHAVDLIVPVTDELAIPLARAQETLPAGCALALPPTEALYAAADKRRTLELARGLGIPVPATAVVETVEEALAAAPALGSPVVVKPLASRVFGAEGVSALRVAYAADEQELAARVRAVAGRCPVLLQEYCAGEGHGVELLLDRGRPLAAFQHRRLREVPITGGASSFRESVPLDPVLHDHAARLLGALGWTGLAMVEFRVGPDGPRLMEVNGRIWGSLPLAVKSGVDFPLRLAALYLPELEAPNGNGANGGYRVGVRSRNLDLELVWIASVLRRARRYPYLPAPPRRRALGAAARLLYPADGYDVLSLDDPRPGLAELRRLAGRLPRKALRGR